MDDAALRGVQAVESFDTTLDSSPTATMLRNAQWLTPKFAAAVASQAPVEGPGAVWTAWASHRAVVTATVSLSGDDHPADTASAAVRAVETTLTPTGRDGWVGPHEVLVIVVSLAIVDGRWLIDAVEGNTP